MYGRQSLGPDIRCLHQKPQNIDHCSQRIIHQQQPMGSEFVQGKIERYITGGFSEMKKKMFPLYKRICQRILQKQHCGSLLQYFCIFYSDIVYDVTIIISLTYLISSCSYNYFLFWLVAQILNCTMQKLSSPPPVMCTSRISQ